jgi:hypothetical protein
MPSVFRAQAGDTIQTLATLTNTGPEVLYYAYGFVDPGTIPVTAVTGQLPPLVLDPGDVVQVVAGTITSHPATKAGEYAFAEGVGYHPAFGLPDVVEASDPGTLVIVPEPITLPLCCLGLAFVACWRSGHLRNERIDSRRR